MIFAGLTPPYSTLCVDPPWAYPLSQRRVAARDRYSVMTIAELCALPVGDLAADDAHLWVWVTARGMAEGWHVPVIAAWGFTPMTVVTWTKPGQPGVGRIVRQNCEFLVLATRGSVPTPAEPAMSSWYAWPRSAGTGGRNRQAGGVHSVKPAAAYDLIERVSPGPRCELFARQGRLGWDSWGLGVEGVLAS